MYQQFQSSIDIDTLIQKRERKKDLSQVRQDIDETLDAVFECLDIPWDREEFDRTIVKLMLHVAERISKLKV